MAGFFVKIKRMTEEVYYLDGHIYQDRINVIFTDDINASIKYQCKRLNISTRNLLAKNADACVCDINRKSLDKSGERVRATWALFDVNKTTDDIIVHECLHIAVSLAYKRGLWLSSATEEAYAYLIQWLFKEIKLFQKDYLKKQKKLKRNCDITN